MGRSQAARVVRGALLAATLIGWFVALRPTSLGGTTTYLLVRGTSMLPTYADGDLLLLQPAESYRIGDPVAYRVPDGEVGAGHLVIHRIVGGSASAGFEMRGDNNDSPDPWHPRAGNVAGKVWIALPAVGRVISFVRRPIVLGMLAASIVIGWFIATSGAARRRPKVRAGWTTS